MPEGVSGKARTGAPILQLWVESPLPLRHPLGSNSLRGWRNLTRKEPFLSVVFLIKCPLLGGIWLVDNTQKGIFILLFTRIISSWTRFLGREERLVDLVLLCEEQVMQLRLEVEFIVTVLFPKDTVHF